MNNRKKLISLIILAALMIFVVCVDIADVFTHGFVCESMGIDDVYVEDVQGTVDLSQQNYQLHFSPRKRHFAGFQLYFDDIPAGEDGKLILTIEDAQGKALEIVTLHQYKLNRLFRVQTRKPLQKGRIYTLTISSEAFEQAPTMMLVDSACLTGESIDDNLLIGYAYHESTFGTGEKILLTVFAVSLALIALAAVNHTSDWFRWGRSVGVFLLLTAVMSWNFCFGSLDNANSNFESFQSDSDALVTGAIEAARDEVWIGGLAIYSDIDGSRYHQKGDISYPTKDDWIQGYHCTESKVRLRASEYSGEYAVAGNHIQFANGDVFRITDTEYDDGWYIVTLDSGRPLNHWKYGDMSDAVFLDAQKNEVPKGFGRRYLSQYGLQGQVFRHLEKYLRLDTLRVLTAIGTACILMAIVYLIAARYNSLMAGVYYCAFLLSPWIVNFARNLYWVEFTWFLPMAAGLLCAWKYDSRRVRIITYCLAFLTILLKCLCGYEFISTIMMGLIQFLLVDMILAAVNGEQQKTMLLLRTIFWVGVAALAGFAVAICLHAPLKSNNGNLLEGIALIVRDDVLRRTYGGDLNIFEPSSAYGMSLCSSVWEVLCKYYNFSTEIITGVPGNLFPLLNLVPLAIFACDAKQKKLNLQWVLMYAVFLIAPISWFVLAKAHSYIHTHMNYVLWYFGFIQICLYIIVAKIENTIKQDKRDL